MLKYCLKNKSPNFSVVYIFRKGFYSVLKVAQFQVVQCNELIDF